MATRFVLDSLTIPMPDGRVFTFWFDGNGKITYGNGSFDNPVANSFSLVQIQDCPFATETCRSTCYVHGLEKKEAEVHGHYYENSRTIREVLSNSCYFEITARAFANYITKNCSGGFRWHVSGDIFSPTHSIFIRMVCEMSPRIKHIIYTRSFVYITPLLIGPSNLVLNLSADKDNFKEALVWHGRFGSRICYLTIDGEVPENLPIGSVIFPAYELRGRDLLKPTQAPWWQSLNSRQRKMVYPPDFFGQSESYRCGPCRKCLKRLKKIQP